MIRVGRRQEGNVVQGLPPFVLLSPIIETWTDMYNAALKGEQVDPASSGDMHEAINFGTEQSFSGAATPVGTGNQWPSKETLPEFRPAVEAAWFVFLIERLDSN